MDGLDLYQGSIHFLIYRRKDFPFYRDEVTRNSQERPLLRRARLSLEEDVISKKVVYLAVVSAGD